MFVSPWNRNAASGNSCFTVKHGFLSGREEKKRLFTWNGDFVSRGNAQKCLFHVKQAVVRMRTHSNARRIAEALAKIN